MASPSDTKRELEERMRKARSYEDTEYGTAKDTIRRRVKNLYVTRGKLLSWRKECVNQRESIDADIKDADERLDMIEGLIAKLETEEGQTEVSEHAILRFLQRVKGVDIDALAEEVKAFDPERLVKRGNVIITVNGVLPDEKVATITGATSERQDDFCEEAD